MLSQPKWNFSDKILWAIFFEYKNFIEIYNVGYFIRYLLANGFLHKNAKKRIKKVNKHYYEKEFFIEDSADVEYLFIPVNPKKIFLKWLFRYNFLFLDDITTHTQLNLWNTIGLHKSNKSDYNIRVMQGLFKKRKRYLPYAKITGSYKMVWQSFIVNYRNISSYYYNINFNRGYIPSFNLVLRDERGYEDFEHIAVEIFEDLVDDKNIFFFKNTRLSKHWYKGNIMFYESEYSIIFFEEGEVEDDQYFDLVHNHYYDELITVSFLPQYKINSYSIFTNWYLFFDLYLFNILELYKILILIILYNLEFSF